MKLENLEKKIEKYKFIEVISCLMLCWSIYQLYFYLNVLSGDAEIHLIFAKNFVNGHFLEFNPGYKTGGESSFLYFLIVSFIYKFLTNYTYYAMKLISVISFIWILYQIYEINPSQSFSLKLIGSALFSVITLVTFQVMLGMENIFFTAILITLLSQEIKSGIKFENKAVILKSIFLFLLRPEGLLYPFFLSIKSLFTKNKKLLFYSFLSFLICGLTYYILSIISGGDFHNAGSIRKYLSTVQNKDAINLNFLGYNLHLGIVIFRKLIYVYPVIFLAGIFKKYILKFDLIVVLIFIIIPLFMHFFNFIPVMHFTRYFLYGYSLIFTLFAARVIPNLPKFLVSLLAILYLSGSLYSGLRNTASIICPTSESYCLYNNNLNDFAKSISNENIKRNSDIIFKELSKDPNDIIDIATVEIQIKNRLDDRFRVWSLDGLNDREITKFKGKDFIDHFKYLKFRDIDLLASLPNLNRSNYYDSLKDFAIDLNQSTPTYCTEYNVRNDDCFLRKEEKLSSKCINNLKLSKTNIKSWYLNLGGWNGGWLWQVERCN